MFRFASVFLLYIIPWLHPAHLQAGAADTIKSTFVITFAVIVPLLFVPSISYPSAFAHIVPNIDPAVFITACVSIVMVP